MSNGDEHDLVQRAAWFAGRGVTSIRHVYAHYPFCVRKCPYCDFNSHAGLEHAVDDYVAALGIEATVWRSLLRPRTIFVGGGTPTHADAEQLARYLLTLRSACDTTDLEEFTVEANPGTLSDTKVAVLRHVGVDRVSLGAQSFQPKHLEQLGRIHEVEDTIRSVEALRVGGMPSISLDLILAIPGQTLPEQASDLRQLFALRPEHCSAYVLTFEQGTTFTRWMEAGRLPAPDADRELAHLHMACEYAQAEGFQRYEISNFARPGQESRHNLAYWKNADWLGLGAGAHSHVAGRRWKNVDDPVEYVRRVRAGVVPLEFEEEIAPSTRLFESLMMGLRLVDGVDLEVIERATGLDARVELEDAIATHAAGGLLAIEGARMRLTSRGLDLADHVIRSFLPD